ncbi:alpha,alpha-trehalose-phosphate synthase (UDP-forming) [Serinibacter salmoneus]|uniref:alpha,alpha-trehalose-phosphate synthase (UDP-forming) n=1 Tax=Serinibacter salmoneus TaxID=556530 RepID=UPI000BF4F61D|nr:trehalose-6-phosphate synthase [Serinibacter salmoneus]
MLPDSIDPEADGAYDFVVVANRLPVDADVAEDGSPTWKRAPGGLVTALAPIMRANDGAWVGWPGKPDVTLEPFDADGMHLVPVDLSEQDVELYYEGFSNGTLWPLLHDAVVDPVFHRAWWNAYVRVNRRFAKEAAKVAAKEATVWIQDYQLLLVPTMLRALRPDLRIGFFLHIPFPPPEIFAQLPWRKQILDGLLGADLIGTQRTSDAGNIQRSVRRLTEWTTRGQVVTIGSRWTRPERHVRIAAFPISIDTTGITEVAQRPEVIERAKEIRRDLGDPDTVLLGVDRLDYTKGIRHRLKAFGELLHDGRLVVPEVTLVQVASPSRENVDSYKQLRDEVEVTVGRINGDHGSLGRAAIHYMHHSYPLEEMVALYLAADVMLVTALRDGMNLVAKEYVAARVDLDGVLVLSEFAGAADELAQALIINPHDIDGMKRAITEAIDMRPKERRRRMRSLRRRVVDNDVQQWAKNFLGTLNAGPSRTSHV